MKKYIIAVTTLISTIGFSQVGINTENPQATLDVKSSPADLTKTDGIIAPKLTGNELKSKDALYTNELQGAIVYATSAASPATAKTQNVTAEGYYYFNGFQWVKFSSNGADISIYTDNGSLTANRTVALNGNNLSFSGNGNLGIGTAAPSEKLDVAGNIAVNVNANGTASAVKFYENSSNGSNSVSLKAPANIQTNRSLTLPSNAPVNGYVLTTDDSGVTAWSSVNPASATLASISLSSASFGSTGISNGGSNGTTVDQRFFQKFDNTVTDPNQRFNVNTGTYTVAQSGIYLISAYIMPNAAPFRNDTGFYYPVNLEIRKNCGGNPSGGVNIMDNATIRWATPGQGILRYSVVVTGMVSLKEGDTLNAVIFLNGFNAFASSSSGISYPENFTYAITSDFKALFSVTAL